MSITLRIVLIIVSIITFFYITRKIRQSKLKMEDSIIWIIGSLALILMSIFYRGIEWLSNKIGFVSPANFVFLMVCFFLLLIVFYLNIKMSILNEKIKDLNHYIALKEYNDEKNERGTKDEK